MIKLYIIRYKTLLSFRSPSSLNGNSFEFCRRKEPCKNGTTHDSRTSTWVQNNIILFAWEIDRQIFKNNEINAQQE